MPVTVAVRCDVVDKHPNSAYPGASVPREAEIRTHQHDCRRRPEPFTRASARRKEVAAAGAEGRPADCKTRAAHMARRSQGQCAAGSRDQQAEEHGAAARAHG